MLLLYDSKPFLFLPLPRKNLQPLTHLMKTIRAQIDEFVQKFRHTQQRKKWLAASEDEQRDMLARYYAGIYGQFQMWLAVTGYFVRHESSQWAVKSNIRCEMVQSHQQLLRNFIVDCRALPSQRHYTDILCGVNQINALFTNPVTAGLAGLMVIAILETTSKEFVPILSEVAEKLGAEEFTYCEIHGEADGPHSEDFIDATVSELQDGGYSMEDQERGVSEAIKAVDTLLTEIF